MEITIASRHANFFYSTESKRDKVEFKKNVNFSKGTTKEEMSTSTSQPIHIMEKPKLRGKKSSPFKVATNKHPTLKELREKKYLFPDSDLSGVLDDLLEKGVIEFPELKCQKKLGEPSTLNTIGTIESLVTLLKNVLHSRSALCDWLRKEESF